MHYVLQMISIEELKNSKEDNTKPYQKALRVNIIRCSTKTYYRNSKQENRVLYHLALADNTGTIKATCYDESYYMQTKEQNGMIIRNYLYKNGILLITKQTKIARMPPLTIYAGIIEEAEQILQPLAPPVSPIKTVREAAVKTVMSISGTITKVEDTKTIFVNGQDTKIKSITINDATDSVKISLWREASDFTTDIGQYVQLTHLSVHMFNGEKILNTTRNTTIQEKQPPHEDINVTIFGVETTRQENSTMAVQITGSDHIQSMDINNTILMDFLSIETDTEDFENSLMQYLPISLNVSFCNGCITEIIKQL
ncbi:uncharacterized protein LOC144782842 [Lissotriton helveticus]